MVYHMSVQKLADASRGLACELACRLAFCQSAVVTDNGQMLYAFANEGVHKDLGGTCSQESADHYGHAVLNACYRFISCYDFVEHFFAFLAFE
jgi:hypothetical protein